MGLRILPVPDPNRFYTLIIYFPQPKIYYFSMIVLSTVFEVLNRSLQFKLYAMKHFLLTLKQKADSLLEHVPSTENRSVPFRITTLILLSASVFCIAYYYITRILWRGVAIPIIEIKYFFLFRLLSYCWLCYGDN